VHPSSWLCRSSASRVTTETACGVSDKGVSVRVAVEAVEAFMPSA
jgi:hypothetical protein